MWLLDLLPCPLHTVMGMGQHQWQVVEEIYLQTYLQEKMLNTKLDALTWLCRLSTDAGPKHQCDGF